MGVSFIAISTSHFYVRDLDDERNDINSFIEKQNKQNNLKPNLLSKKKKVSTGLYAIHPFTKRRNSYLDSKFCS